MKAAFLFDTFLIQENNNYYGMTLTYEFFKERYLKYYDEILVSTRSKKINSENGNITGYKITNGDKVTVKPIKSYNNILDGIIKRKKIKEEITKILDECDIAIIRLPSMIGNLACEVCKKINKKYIVEMVACAWDGYVNHHNKFGKVIAPYMFLETRKKVKNAPTVLYVTEKFLQQRYPTKGKGYSCSDVIIEKPDNMILEKRLQHIENNDKIIKLGTVANVGLKYKGQEFVIKALYTLKKQGKNNYRYYLVGNGDNKYLKNIVKKYRLENEVIFMGSLKHKEVFDFINNIDIYIQPSLQEGLPRALIEAMSRACPCIGSNAGGIPELLDQENIFNKRDYKKLCNILTRINKKDLKNMATNNFLKVKKYSKEVLEKQRNMIYEV